MSKINIHAGHNAPGKTACGAVGLLDESRENRRVKNELIKILKEDHTVYDCTVDNAKSVNDNLYEIVAKCNAHKVDLDVSLHLNSGAKDKKGNGKTTGTEVLVTSTDGIKGKAAANICKEMAALGFKSRGTKIRNDLYVLNRTTAKALLVEICFVDDRDDYNLYNKLGPEKIARAIAKGINDALPGNKEKEFKVKVKASALNIRKGPGTKYGIVSAITGYGTYTITETDGNWGKLKSGKGWINISDKYCKRL